MLICHLLKLINVFSDIGCVTNLANVNLNELTFYLSSIDGSGDISCLGATIGLNLIVDCDDGSSYIYDDLDNPICTSDGDIIELIPVLNLNINKSINYRYILTTIHWTTIEGKFYAESAEVLLFKKNFLVDNQ